MSRFFEGVLAALRGPKETGGLVRNNRASPVAEPEKLSSPVGSLSPTVAKLYAHRKGRGFPASGELVRAPSKGCG